MTINFTDELTDKYGFFSRSSDAQQVADLINNNAGSLDLAAEVSESPKGKFKVHVDCNEASISEIAKVFPQIREMTEYEMGYGFMRQACDYYSPLGVYWVDFYTEEEHIGETADLKDKNLGLGSRAIWTDYNNGEQLWCHVGVYANIDGEQESVGLIKIVVVDKKVFSAEFNPGMDYNLPKYAVDYKDGVDVVDEEETTAFFHFFLNEYTDHLQEAN